jgi:hypothetical protein
LTDLAIAKQRLELFKNPILFDDHFIDDWASNPAGGTVLDGEVVRLTVQGGQTIQNYERTIEFNPNTFKYFIVRLTDGLFTSKVWVRRKSDSAWLQVGTPTLGLNAFDITSVCTTTVDRISLQAYGSPGVDAEFDYVAISESTYGTLGEDDLVGELKIINSVLSKGANFMSFTVQNFGNESASKILENAVVISWVSRDSGELGTVAAKAFGGRIKKITPKALGFNSYYIDVECHGHAIELIKPPSRLTKVYSAINGRTIIEEALGLAAYVAKHPIASKWFDNAGSSGSTDDRINSTHSKSYTRATPWEVIKELLDLASNPSSVIGFDIFETPSGALVGHLRNSLDFVSDVASLTPEKFSKITDVHTVINCQQVLGRFRFQTGDAGWDDSLSGWTARIGTILSPNPGYILVDNDGLMCEVYRTMSPYDLLSADPTETPEGECVKHLYCQVLMNNGNAGNNSIWVIFECDTESDYFYHTYSNVTQNLNYEVDQDLGDENTGAGKFWTKAGNADWNKIKNITFYAATGSGAGMYITIDYLKITPLRFRSVYQDATSQAAYGVVDGDPQIDETLSSDSECFARAKSIVGVKKDPAITLENVVADGTLSYKPSYRQRIVVSDLSIDETRRIVEVEHTIKGSVWDSKLVVSAESQALDLAFKVASERIKMLEGRA